MSGPDVVPDVGASGLRRLVVGSFAARAATVLLGALGGVVLARALGAEGRGAYAVVVTISSTAIALGHLSLEAANVSLWKRRDLRPSLIANVLSISICWGAVVAGCAWVVVQLLGERRVPVYDEAGLALALVAVPLGLLGLWANGLLSLSARVGRLNIGLVLSAVLQTGALLLLAVSGHLTVTSVVVVWVVSMGIPLVVSLPTLRPRRRDMSLRVARIQLLSGLRYHPGVALMFLLLKVDLLVVNAYRPARDVGLYALAVTLAELVYLLADSVSQAIISRQAEGGTAAAEITAKAVRLNAWGCLVLASLLAGSAPLLVPFVYGSEFGGSVPALLVLLPGVMALAVARPLVVLLAALERPGLLASLAAGAFALHLLALWLLLPAWGIVGAAGASTVAYLALAVGYLCAGRLLTHTPWRAYRPGLSDLRDALQRAR